MASVRPTLVEKAFQISATDALKIAAHHRENRAEYLVWVKAAAKANSRTRTSMIERGVLMRTPSTRSVTQ